MQFNFNINEIICNPIEIIDHKSKLDFYNHYIDPKSIKNLSNSQKLSYLIDAMGNASQRAQNLPHAITTSGKLRGSDQRVYLLKEAAANEQNGELVGLLKTGRKRLFLYDLRGQQHETEPLCVLDFYVAENRQRRGYGRRLFEYMLATENMRPHNLAIDRPSEKFLSFLAKHYNLSNPLGQSNNFVVFNEFFNADSLSRSMVPFGRHHRISTNQQNHSHSSLSQHQPQTLPSKTTPTHSPQRQQQSQLESSSQQGSLNNFSNKGSPARIRSRKNSANEKERISTESINIAPTTQSVATVTKELISMEPPLLPRGDSSALQRKWYLNNIISPTVTRIDSQILPKIPHKYVNQNGQSISDTNASIYACRNAAKSSPSIAAVARQPVQSAIIDRQHYPHSCHSHNQHNAINNQSLHLVKPDYDYSQGLARHYSHTRIW